VRTSLHLFSLANEAQWASSRLVDSDNTTDDTRLSWGGKPPDPTSGFAGPTSDQLEDGSMPHLTIHTHPRWVPHGTIKGWMPWRRIGQRPMFRTKVGFIRGAGGEVTFQVWAHHRVAGREVWNKSAQLTKRADGVLRELAVDLGHLAGQEVQIELRVDAGESSGQDWAVWVDPQIEYDEASTAEAETLTVTTAGNWSEVGSVVVLFEAEGGRAFGVSIPAAGQSVQVPFAALGLGAPKRYRVLTIPQGAEELAWRPLPAERNLVVEPSDTRGSGVHFGDTVEVAATVWAVDPAGGPSRQLGAITMTVTVGTAGLSELATYGLKAPDRLMDALLGASPGQQISLALDPQDAFGILQPGRPTDISRAELPVEPAIGMPFALEGEADTYWVVSIQDDTIRLDVNHPWAGYRIRFDGAIAGPSSTRPVRESPRQEPAPRFATLRVRR
jgi:hypothetical protein